MAAGDKIRKTALRLVREFGTRDPFAIARGLGVQVLFRNDFTRLKGMYKVILRNRYIFINANLEPAMQHLVCAHELGHDLLHRRFFRAGTFQEFVLYDMKSKPEFEANVFAAELLLEDSVVDSCLKGGYDVFQVAGMLGVDVNLLLVKVNQMYEGGAPELPPRDFLGK